MFWAGIWTPEKRVILKIVSFYWALSCHESLHPFWLLVKELEGWTEKWSQRVGGQQKTFNWSLLPLSSFVSYHHGQEHKSSTSRSSRSRKKESHFVSLELLQTSKFISNDTFPPTRSYFLILSNSFVPSWPSIAIYKSIRASVFQTTTLVMIAFLGLDYLSQVDCI